MSVDDGESPARTLPGAERSTITGADGVVRCAWATEGDPRYRAYHDTEWGRPSRDGHHLFEMLVLEGAQAGLAWSTILHKRDGYRRAFCDFDPSAVARFGEPDVARLLADPRIVRNRRKVESAVANARLILAIEESGASFPGLVWGFVNGVPRDRRPASLGEIPADTPESRAMSRELARRGFRFVGPTICHAFMQATGMVNDHVVGCAAGEEVRAAVG